MKRQNECRIPLENKKRGRRKTSGGPAFRLSKKAGKHSDILPLSKFIFVRTCAGQKYIEAQNRSASGFARGRVGLAGKRMNKASLRAAVISGCPLSACRETRHAESGAAGSFPAAPFLWMPSGVSVLLNQCAQRLAGDLDGFAHLGICHDRRRAAAADGGDDENCRGLHL